MENKCDECGKSFRTPGGLNMHKVRMHTEAGAKWGVPKRRKPWGNRKKQAELDLRDKESPSLRVGKPLTIDFCPGCGMSLAPFKLLVKLGGK